MLEQLLLGIFAVIVGTLLYFFSRSRADYYYIEYIIKKQTFLITYLDTGVMGSYCKNRFYQVVWFVSLILVGFGMTVLIGLLFH